MTLIELQRDMRAWLTREDAAAATRFGDDAAPGLRIYQNNYRAQLAACLEESFEHTRDWIGAEAFHQAIVTHVDRVPPSSWTLDAYSRDFPATLALLYPADREVIELAWLDMALGEAFVAADAATLTAEDLAGVDWDHAVLRLRYGRRWPPAMCRRQRNFCLNRARFWSGVTARPRNFARSTNMSSRPCCWSSRARHFPNYAI